jgi:hypothetical protein
VVSWSVFLAADPGIRVRFPALPDFLGGGGPGAGSSHPREYLIEKVAAPVWKIEITAVGDPPR